jgi:hypothetical protein
MPRPKGSAFKNPDDAADLVLQPDAVKTAASRHRPLTASTDVGGRATGDVLPFPLLDAASAYA